MKHTQVQLPQLLPDVERRLRQFESLLLRWNARINLVSRTDASDVWARHIMDSVQIGPLLPPGPGEIIDLGSGAGFPGLIVALTTGRHVHLVESDQRKAAFLREAIRETNAPATVHAVRAEALTLPPATIVTARALAPLGILLALASPRLAQGGVCLFPKGATVDDELTAAANEWHMRLERFQSRTSASATILRISEIRRAGHAI